LKSLEKDSRVGFCATLPTFTGVAETTLSRASIHSSMSNLQGLRAFGLVTHVSRRSASTGSVVRVLPLWLQELLSRNRNDLKLQVYTHPLDMHSTIREGCVKALLTHLDCKFCIAVHVKNGFAYCVELENKLAQARDKVSLSFYCSSTTS